MRERRKKNAFTGSYIRINSVPTAPPIHAPNIGISAVIPITTETTDASGNLKMSIPTKQSSPRMIASVN